MSPSAPAIAVTAAGFPRVSGDEPHALQAAAGGLEFSPRERG